MGKEHEFNSRFAMTAPWSIELDQDIFLVVKHDIFVVLRNNHRYRSFLLLRDGLGLDAGLDLAINIVLHELAHVLVGNFCSGEGELLVLDCILDSEGRPFADLEVQVAGVSAESFGINGGKVDFALVFLSEGLELSGELCPFLGSFREDVGKWNASLQIIVSTRLDGMSNLRNLPPCSQHTSRVPLRQQEVC